MFAAIYLLLSLILAVVAVASPQVRRWFTTRTRPARALGLIAVGWLVLFTALAGMSPNATAPTATQAGDQQSAGPAQPTPSPPTGTTPSQTSAATLPTTPTTTAATTTTAAVSDGRCQVRYASGQPLPDPVCTPGSTNDAVTAATIGTTICRAGWTATIRPPESVTEPLKLHQITAYSYADADIRHYEEDHLIPLELGGSPTDPKNLWPEFDNGVIPNAKDAVENTLRRAVCDHQVELVAAQQAIASDWTTALAILGLTGNVAPAPAPTTEAAPVAPVAPPPPGGGGVYYKNCAAVRAAGAAPLHRGEPGYRPALDRDGDGIACEK